MIDVSTPKFAYRYQAGGSLPANASTYVVRQADRELYNALLAGEYCYVLNSRQMGKSSLRIQTMQKLTDRGMVCAEVELSGIGSQEINPQQWYGGIIQELISGFDLQVSRRKWLKEQEDLSAVQRLGKFIETVLLKEIKENIVIFIDEIDSVLSLRFGTDDFFALIRNCYDKRASKPEYRRLSFALLGVATPSDLIQDEKSTPFNIGKAIELQGFQFCECQSLAKGLLGRVNNPQQALKEILYWTAGQPFQTQKLCSLITQHSDIKAFQSDKKTIRKIVHKYVIDNWESQDEPEHLRTVRDRILRNARSTQKLLQIYKIILQRGKVLINNSYEHLELRLSGLVCQRKGYLIVKNPIYKSIFNLNWVKQQLRSNEFLSNNSQILTPTNNILDDENLTSASHIWTGLAASIAVTMSIIGIRYLGLLQGWELQSFDSLMRQRPTEKPDDRIVLVTITEEDVKSQPADERQAASLSDRSLEQLLSKLLQHQPNAIGLDIYRERKVRAEYPQLAHKMRQAPNLFGICKYGSTSPPPELTPERQGFNNVLLDTDRVIRRHLLAISDSSEPCESKYAFNWQLATHYLADKGIEVEFTSDGYLKLGKTVFTTIELQQSNTGGYRNFADGGHQILLNYRATNKIAHKYSLREILEDKFNPESIKNKIILVGTVAPSFNDHLWRTPYSGGQWSIQTISGVELQAHMVSQILSSVLDNRPLISALPLGSENIWIFCSSIIGSLLAWIFSSSRIKLIVYTVIGNSIVYFICWLSLTINALWLPLIPIILASLGTTGLTIFLIKVDQKMRSR